MKKRRSLRKIKYLDISLTNWGGREDPVWLSGESTIALWEKKKKPKICPSLRGIHGSFSEKLRRDYSFELGHGDDLPLVGRKRTRIKGEGGAKDAARGMKREGTVLLAAGGIRGAFPEPRKR